MTTTRFLLLLAAVTLVPTVPALAQSNRPKPVNRVGIDIRPQAITFGSAATVSGVLRGSAPARKRVVLIGAPFPFQTFAPVAGTTTGPRARYSFRVSPPITMRYQAISTTAPAQASSIEQLTVRQRVEAAISDTTPRRHSHVIFSGAVGPGNPGAIVYVQRRSIFSGRFRTIKRTRLRDAGLTRSVFSTRVGISRSGLYAVRVRGTDYNAQGYSGLLGIHVH
jgi:hypothetical protein